MSQSQSNRINSTTTYNSTTTTLRLMNHTTEICLNLPFNINSKGLWGDYNDHHWWLNNSLPRLELQLVLFCLSMVIIRFLLKGFGLSRMSTRILAGLIFGCSWKHWDEKRYKLFIVESQATLSVFIYFGYMLYLFVLALKMDVRMIARTKRKALIVGLPTLFGPILCGRLVAALLLKDLDMADQAKVPLMVNLHSMVSFPVIENLLSELKIVNSEIGRLGLSAALVGDMLSQLVISVSNMIRIYQVSALRGIFSLGGFFVAAFLVCFVFKPAVVWIIKSTPKGEHVSGQNIQGVICLVLLSSVFSVLFAQPAFFGPYLLGLIIPDGSPLVISMIEKLDLFVSELFLPIFITLCALQADLSKIFVAFGAGFTQFNIVVAFVTFSVKVISSFLGSLYCKLPVQDSLALAFIMSNKGVVELLFITILRGYDIISDGLLTWLTVIILLVATFVPFPVKYLYDPSTKYAISQNRNIMNLPRNSELRVLVCVHQNKETHGLIHLLNLSCPTKQNPLAIYVLHLVELVGRITPIFISHKHENYNHFIIHQEESCSENIVLCFEEFESEKNGTACVECFTTITPQKLMQSEICRLAVEKSTSLIILPFHQSWTTADHDHVDQEDNTIRSLNWSVIEKGPCSVGIFADRGNLGSTMRGNHYSVCLIFLGGSDDREGLAYAKRMAKDSRVELTVMRLVSATEADGSSGDQNWEEMLDKEALRDFKMNCSGEGRSVRYIEGVSEDGIQTAMRIREMVNEFDLIIVGRREGFEQSSPQTCGLGEWNEFPELGILGDLILSLEMNIRASVLVIHSNNLIIN